METLSLFDGMSCGQIALNESGHEVKYYASEIDKFAIAQTQLNFPDTIQLGDIENWRKWNIDWSKIGLILAGSPCQGFSFAGKQLNFNDERSKLFFVFVDILNHCKKFNPDVKFLLENVNMKKEYQKVINDMLGLFPVRINSNLVSAQNRDRLYWTNIKIKMVGLFNEVHSDIPQPKDRKILLKDILQPESEVDGKYCLSSTAINRMLRKEYSNPKINPVKTGSLNTKNNSGQCCFDSGTTLIGLDINKKAPTQRSSTGRCLDKKHNYQIIKIDGVLCEQEVLENGLIRNKIIKLDKQLNKKVDQNKAGCLTAGAHSGGNHSDMDILAVGCVKFGRSEEGKKIRRETKDKDYTPFQAKEINYIDYDKMNTVTCATTKDNLLLVPESTKKGFTEINPGNCVDLENLKSKTRRGRKMENKSNCLMTGKTEFHKYTEDYKLRRLTPLECARLQTIPSSYIWNCSDTQQYKMLGNGWTIEVIKHIFSYL